MQILTLNDIRRVLSYADTIPLMREALLADCDTPMPMHLDIARGAGEVHMKSSYARGGKYFALKVASAGNGMMLLFSAETGEPLVFLADQGHLTDVRTAAVSAMIARETGRKDRILGILGTGIQARLTARMHREVLPIERVVIWGRNPERAEQCAREIGAERANCPGEVARVARLIVTCTAARAPLLFADDLQPGTHITAVGSDGEGKQELDPEILRRADWVLADSVRQCERLGELQHAPGVVAHEFKNRAFCPGNLTVADLTGLGVEDLFIAQHVYERSVS
jgi:ornithine cyclodeaminase